MLSRRSWPSIYRSLLHPSSGRRQLASLKIGQFLYDYAVQHSYSPPWGPENSTLSQSNLAQTFKFYFVKIYFNLTYHKLCLHVRWCVPFRFSRLRLLCTCDLMVLFVVSVRSVSAFYIWSPWYTSPSVQDGLKLNVIFIFHIAAKI
jgi:hypothetical protein